MPRLAAATLELETTLSPFRPSTDSRWANVPYGFLRDVLLYPIFLTYVHPFGGRSCDEARVRHMSLRIPATLTMGVRSADDVIMGNNPKFINDIDSRNCLPTMR